ncbi:MAG: hypothetical protein ACXV7D_04865 [Thermoanaerobaculia bacterium]
MARYGQVCFLAIFLVTTPMLAQQTTSDDKLQQLEKRLNDLTRQADEIRQELNLLKGTPSAPAPAAAEEDLTKVGVVPSAPTTPSATAEQTPPAAAGLTDVQTINNVPNPGASKVFNPDISVIGNFLGKAGQPNPVEFGPDDRRPTMTLDEAEVAFQAFVDPYAKANFFLSLTPQGIDVEEGYATFVTLPYDLTAKAGKFKALFGKDNTWHTHVRPWIDQPLVIHNFFGDEGLNDYGISVSKVIPNPYSVFLEATGEAFRGDVANVFQHRNPNDLFYNAHLKAFRDIGEDNNIEVGTSYARGALAGGTPGNNQFAGLDVTYRWKPLVRGLYNSFIGRVEAITDHRDDFNRNLKGIYVSGDYQLARRWFTGVRFDSADRAVLADNSSPLRFTDRGASATLTFWPSEFSQLRGQLRRIHYGDIDRSVNELLLQLQFSIGAHGAHSF